MQSLGQLFCGSRRISGFIALGAHRLKEFSMPPGAFEGFVGFFDTDVAPSTISSASQSGTTITVVDSNHGLSVGDTIGIIFYGGSNNDPDSGNYTIATVPNANTFTLTSLNSDTVSLSIGVYVSNTGNPNSPRRFVVQKQTLPAGADEQDIPTSYMMPEAGFAFKNGMWCHINWVGPVNVIYE